MHVDLIVSRHPALIEFIEEEIGCDIPVIDSPTPDDVRGKVVAGTLPLHLAALCKEVINVELDAPIPEPDEPPSFFNLVDRMGADDMRDLGARLVSYVVIQRDIEP